MSWFAHKPEVVVDGARIEELLTRGVEHILPSEAFLRDRLLSRERLSVYLGIDPTGRTLHLGHLIPLLKLRQFQELGHRVILLIGDFTATIGDPSDKTAVRTALSKEQARKNAETYKKLAGRIITFSGGNPAELRYNSEWLGALPIGEAVRLFSSVTYAQTIKRDMFQERIKEGKDLFLHEFLYPVFQGYDSVALNVDGEVGGNDQTFNMLVGRDLLKKMRGKSKFIIAMKLLVDPSGKKMGKTEGNMVALSDVPGEVFGKIMSWPDSMILAGFELCTRVPVSEITRAKQALEQGENPKTLKTRLAEAVVALLHGEEAAKKAHAGFNVAFSEGKPEEFIEVRLSGREVAPALIEKRIISSKNELRRLLTDGAITNLNTGTKMGEAFLTAASPGTYRIGKHRFIEIR